MRAILMYHSLDESGSPISLPPAVFESHARFLAGGRVTVLPLDQLAGWTRDSDALAVTFDDGFTNFATEAAPRLREFGLPATLFVVSDHQGTNAWGGRTAPGIPTLPLLDWDQLGRLNEAGVTLGGHTRHHPRLSRVGAAELEDEIGGCAERIAERTGQRPRDFAYPYGDLNDDAVEVAARHFGTASTTELKLLDDGDSMHRLPRLDMYYYREPGTLERWGSPAFRLRLALRAGGRQVRRIFQA